MVTHDVTHDTLSGGVQPEFAFDPNSRSSRVGYLRIKAQVVDAAQASFYCAFATAALAAVDAWAVTA
jgi:hypothetical protein